MGVQLVLCYSVNGKGEDGAQTHLLFNSEYYRTFTVVA